MIVPPGLRTRRAWVAVALLVAACGGSGNASRPDAPLWTLAGPEVHIGSVDDPAYAFGTVMAMAPGPDSCLYSLHWNEPTVRKWTWDGHPADSIGRRGDGPGEFNTPSGLGFFGDTLWVVDRMRLHASLFTTDGRYLGDEAPHVDLGGRDLTKLPPRPERPLRDGTWFGRTPGSSEAVAKGTLTGVAFVHMDSAGGVLDTLWTQPYRRTDVLALLEPSGGGMFMPQPFGDAPRTQVLDDGSVVVASDRVPQRAEGATFKVTRIGVSGDTMWHTGLSYTPTPLPNSRVDSAARVMAARSAPYLSREGMGMTQAGLEKRLRDAMYAPPFVPFLKGMVVAADGSVWLQRSEVTQDGDEWWVLDPHGRLSGRVHVPGGVRVMLVEGDVLWGVETDDMGVNYIVRYRIERGAE